jgi:hypothetical protein
LIRSFKLLSSFGGSKKYFPFFINSLVQFMSVYVVLRREYIYR